MQNIVFQVLSHFTHKERKFPYWSCDLIIQLWIQLSEVFLFCHV